MDIFSTVPIEDRQEGMELPYMGSMEALKPPPGEEAFQSCGSQDNPFEAPSDKGQGAGLSETRKKAEHEAAEARRKAEWEARQQAKKAAEEAQAARVSAMADDEVMMEAMKRVGDDTERLTRRNMKECVSEHIQTLCLGDPAFARLAMHPRKTMVSCFHYINRHAREYIEAEMKDNDTRPENGVYGGDVPDGLCYQWAEEYFRDPAAEEDRQEEEVFTPKPFIAAGIPGTGKKTAAKKKSPQEKKEGKKPEKEEPENGQLSFLEQIDAKTPVGFAG